MGDCPRSDEEQQTGDGRTDDAQRDRCDCEPLCKGGWRKDPLGNRHTWQRQGRWRLSWRPSLISRRDTQGGWEKGRGGEDGEEVNWKLDDH